MDYRDILKRKLKFFDENEDALFELIRNGQDSLYKQLLKFILKLSTDDEGLLTITEGNYKSLKQINIIVNNFNNQKNNSVTGFIVRKINELFGLNTDYFEAITSVNKSVEARARAKVMLQLGYDATTGKLIEGGYLSSLSEGSNIGSRVALEINRALSLKLNLSDFQRDFKVLLTSDKDSGLGIAERYYKGKVFDLFQRYDREISTQFATDLNLKYFIYSGTIKNNTRSFCEKRNNKIYSVDFAKKDFPKDLFIVKAGAASYYDLNLCGLNNCRHHLSYISEELALELSKTQGLNTYRTVSAKKKIAKKK